MERKRVLFLCTGNSARSQMAEGFLRHLADEKFEVFSAGIKPGRLTPLAIKVMSEIGIDISSHSSKSVSEFAGKSFDYVITVCENANKSCPVFTGASKKIFWNLEDPAAAGGTEEEKIRVFRRIRDVIKDNISEFIRIGIKGRRSY